MRREVRNGGVGIRDEYPYRETLPKTFEKGESKYENPFFAGTHNSKDQDTTVTDLDTAQSAALWKENAYGWENYRPEKGDDFLPRLLYWNKYSPANPDLFSQKQASIQTWASVIDVVHAGSAFTPSPYLSDIYPQATSINRDDSSSPILSYGNVTVRDYDDATGYIFILFSR